MKILYDHQIFQNQNFGGISRYFYELMMQFHSRKDLDYDLSLLYSNNEYIRDLENIAREPRDSENYNKFFGGKEFRGKGFLYKIYSKKDKKKIPFRILNKENTIKKLKEGNFDIFHATYYDDYFLEYIGDKPFVITVYDLIHQIFPEYFPLNTIDKNKNLLEKASAIIVISESTKRDLIDFYHIDEKKIFVTWLSSSLIQKNITFNNSIKNRPEKYILFVGNRTIYKNFYFFMEAYAKISQKFPELEMICTGSKFTPEEITFLKRLGVFEKTHQFFVNDQELIYLYENALFFVFPSLYEGFGIPVLEAFENNCPILLANSSSLPEIGGDAAQYFEPKNFASLCENLELLVSDSSLREKLILAGKERLKEFSWEKTARLTENVYYKILNQKKI